MNMVDGLDVKSYGIITERVDAIVPTVEMRATLKAEGVPLPDGEDLLRLSRVFNEMLEELHRLGSTAKRQFAAEQGKPISFFLLFNEVDRDRSGATTWDEVKSVARSKVGLRHTSKISEAELRALWCALDVDDSDSVKIDEMVRFLKLAPVIPTEKFDVQAHRQKMSAAARAAADAPDENLINAVVPTKQMRAELKEANVDIPGPDELKAFSKSFNQRLEDVRRLEGRAGFSWFDLFREVDRDGSGYITMDELRVIARTKLYLKISDIELQALWCALDLDDSDHILPDEMSKFLRLAPTATSGQSLESMNAKRNREREAEAREAAAAPDLARIDVNIPTKQMRAELTDAGVEIPGPEKLKALSKMYNERLERAKRWENREGFSWYNLFKELDKDGSNFVSYDELQTVTRVKLGVKERQMSENELRALWCALDEDDSNHILPDEMGKFLRLAPTETAKGLAATNAQAYRDKQAAARDAAAAPDMKRIDATVPTDQMRAELREANIELPGDGELKELSRVYNKRLQEVRALDGIPGDSWYNFFKEFDSDGSDYVTFDELMRVTRKRLGLKSAQISGQQLAALWCRLDADDSNQILADEMASFLRLSPPPKVPPPRHGPAAVKVYGVVQDSIDKCVPTTQMRAKLSEDGVSLPGEVELMALSHTFNEKLERSRQRESTNSRKFVKPGTAPSLMDLFNEVDVDHSGAITFDEFARVARQKVGLKVAQVPDAQLEALWCALDVDDSDSIQIDEMFQFLRGNFEGLRRKAEEASRKRQASPVVRKKHVDYDDPVLAVARYAASIEATQKSLAKRGTRIEQLEKQLRKLEGELRASRGVKQRSPRLGKPASRPETASSRPVTAASRPSTSKSHGGRFSPLKKSNVLQIPSQELKLQLRDALLDIAREVDGSRRHLGSRASLRSRGTSRSSPRLLPPLANDSSLLRGNSASALGGGSRPNTAFSIGSAQGSWIDFWA